MSKNYNKVLAVSILAISFSSAVLANGSVPAVTTTADANSNYVYVSLQGGYAWQHLKDYFNTDEGGLFYNKTADNFAVTSSASKEGGIGGRAALGYGFNQNFAVEAGYSYLFNKPTATVSYQPLVAGINGYDVESKLKTQIIDAFFKVQAPVADDFSLYAKVGADYMLNQWKSDEANNHVNKFGPAFGVGAAYNITQNWVADLSWTRYIGQIKINKDWQPNVDFLGLGIAYKFNF